MTTYEMYLEIEAGNQTVLTAAPEAVLIDAERRYETASQCGTTAVGRSRSVDHWQMVRNERKRRHAGEPGW
jgi:hypothetical protein